MDAINDWRVENARHLQRAALRKDRWNAPSAGRDHDHCSCCWAKFADWEGPGVVHDGYTTTEQHTDGAGYHWVCETCFRELKSEMQWRLEASR